MKSIYIYIQVICIGYLFISCKREWLDAKPNKALVVPTTIKDYQAILDNNTGTDMFNWNSPSLSEIGAGDFYISYPSYQGLYLAQERNSYVWASDIYQGETGYDWQNAYNRVLYSNIVLNGIKNIVRDTSNQSSWDNIKGSALFYRSYDFYSLAQEFCKPYYSVSASTDLGIPLRNTSDINVKSVRSSVQQTYDQILNDLLYSAKLLPIASTSPTRPSRNAAFGLLARTYLTMENYDKAYLYADSCLQTSNGLLNYNSLDTITTTPITRFNKEIIYYHLLASYESMDVSTPILNVDSTLYNSYDANDLRKRILLTNFNGINTYKGTYFNDYAFFGGLATDEMYLIRSECNARKGNTNIAMNDLNTLLLSRWMTGRFIPYTATSADDALRQILIERRKELVFRGTRWTDLRRLNRDTRFAVTLTRILNGQNYSLSPNDPRYIYPIPPEEIRLSGIEQNIR